MRNLLGSVALLSFLFFFHNYGLNIFPRIQLAMDPAKMQPVPTGSAFAYSFPFDRSEPDHWMKPDAWFSARSRVRFSENGVVQSNHRFVDTEVLQVGGGRWSHEPGRILFTTTDNSDPRSNGRRYVLEYPALYSRTIGTCSAVVFAIAIVGLYLVSLRKLAQTNPSAPPFDRRWRWHLVGSGALLLTGLYANTGTLAPYGNTLFGHVAPDTGYLYNADHVHFRVLYDFVNGADRSIWDKAIFLRRVLFPVLAWPFMRVAGFEVGGTIASLVFNVTGFVIFLCYLRRKIGDRGAIFAGWLLALYPGASYWGGLPYPYALIFPLSLLLMAALMELGDASPRKLAVLSLAMGVAYLGYDLIPFFLPASLVVLAWRKRPGAAVLSALLQVVPLALWLLVLVHRFGQPLSNSNSSGYAVVLRSFLGIKDAGTWWHFVSYFPNAGLDIWFGANFIFIPAFFLVVVALNAVTSRLRLLPTEAALLGAGLILFLFNNLAPDYYGLGWVFRGTWISRLYQPVFPALIVFCARWWQELPRPNRTLRAIIGTSVAATMLGNALVIFGPALNNPLRVSEEAFYRFYDHTDLHWVYEAHLKDFGRRPLGFPHRQQP